MSEEKLERVATFNTDSKQLAASVFRTVISDERVMDMDSPEWKSDQGLRGHLVIFKPAGSLHEVSCQYGHCCGTEDKGGVHVTFRINPNPGHEDFLTRHHDLARAPSGVLSRPQVRALHAYLTECLKVFDANPEVITALSGMEDSILRIEGEEGLRDYRARMAVDVPGAYIRSYITVEEKPNV